MGEVQSLSCRETLTEEQLAWVKKTEKLVYSLLEETPPDGPKFVSTVKHILKVCACVYFSFIYFFQDRV